MDKRILFVIIYILGDLFYVYISKSVYDKAVMKIQGSGMPSSRIVSAVAAWSCMGLGWYFLTTAAIEKLIKNGMSPLQAGGFAGFINGLAVIGTFNLTAHAMFMNYDWSIMTRDMLWGISWVTIVSILYSLTL